MGLDKFSESIKLPPVMHCCFCWRMELMTSYRVFTLVRRCWLVSFDYNVGLLNSEITLIKIQPTNYECSVHFLPVFNIPAHNIFLLLHGFSMQLLRVPYLLSDTSKHRKFFGKFCILPGMCNRIRYTQPSLGFWAVSNKEVTDYTLTFPENIITGLMTRADTLKFQ